MQMVTMADYEGYNGFSGGFGNAGQNDVEELNKALTSNYQSPRTDGSAALRVESLEATLRVLTFNANHVKLWRVIPKLPAYSTSEEYNVQTSYGQDNGMFTLDGELPQTQDASYERRVSLVKFIGCTKEVSYTTTLVKPAHGNVIALETSNAATWIMERTERALFGARQDVIPQAWDGLDQQIQNDPIASVQNIIDLRGSVLTPEKIEEGANIIVEAYGVPTDFYAAPRAISDLGKQYYPKERINLPAPVNGRVGVTVSEVNTTAGVLPLNSDVFLRSGGNNGRKKAPASQTSNRAPSAPTVTGAVGGSGSQFAAADVGTYQYKVSAINRFGESTSGQLSGGAAVASAGQNVTLTITDGGGGDPATGYRVYRSFVGGAVGTEQWIADVPRATTGTTAYVDANQYLPNTSRGYMFQVNTQSLAFKQLAPMLKVPLATVAISIRWSQVLFGVPQMYAPQKNVIYINCADD